MSVYRFKVSFEEHEDISREIEIKSIQTFKDLHLAIQEAIGFDASQPASFYMSNDHWTKGQEISSEPRTSKSGEKSVPMAKAILKDWIVDPHQKIYYIFDYDAQWSFYIELYRIFPSEEILKRYPLCVKVSGDAPKQRSLVLPVKANELGIEEEPQLITDDYEDEDEVKDDDETVIDEDEADEIKDEGSAGEEI